jgi:hypothetical protein
MALVVPRSRRPRRRGELAVNVFVLQHPASVPLRIDERLECIYIVHEPIDLHLMPLLGARRNAPPRTRPVVIGSTQAFGAIYAFNLAAAYNPLTEPMTKEEEEG